MTTTKARAKRKRPACTCETCKHARAAKVMAKKDAALAAARVLVSAVDELRDEGFDGLAIRARYFAVLQANDRLAATLAYVDESEQALRAGREEGRQQGDL